MDRAASLNADVVARHLIEPLRGSTVRLPTSLGSEAGFITSGKFRIIVGKVSRSQASAEAEAEVRQAWTSIYLHFEGSEAYLRQILCVPSVCTA
jgi:hypothetical protein